MLGLSCMLVLCAFQQVYCDNSDNAVASCGNFTRDWYPSVKPQTSAAPYALNISDEDGKFSLRSWRDPIYGSKGVQTVRLSGLISGNGTEKFVGFLITAKNEFADEENGNFIAPFPDGASRVECKDLNSQMIEVVQNSSSGKEWTSIDIKWRAPEKYPAGKITISASVVKEHGVFWEGISVTLDYVCAGPQCANHCPNGYAKTKFGCTTCICAGSQAMNSNFFGLVFAVIVLVSCFSL